MPCSASVPVHVSCADFESLPLARSWMLIHPRRMWFHVTGSAGCDSSSIVEQ